jgi:hypothetical protein
MLVVCRPGQNVTPGQIAAHAAAEMAALRQLRAAGSLLEAYSPGGPGAILIFDGDRAGVARALESLPLLREGLIEAEVIELHPFAGL